MGIFDEYRQKLTDAGFETFGKFARWTQGGGVPTDVVVKLQQPDADVPFGNSRAIVPTAVLKVRPGEIAEPAQDDIVEVFADETRLVSTGRLKLIGEPEMLDPYGREWTCGAVAL